MKHTSLLRAGVVSLATISWVACGCGTKKDNQPTSDREKPIPLLAGVDAPKPVLNSVDRTDEAGTNALARTTTSYADQMEQMLADRAAEIAKPRLETEEGASAPVAEKPTASNQAVAVAREPAVRTPAPSEVQFAEPAALPPVADANDVVQSQRDIPAARVQTVSRTNEVKTPAPAPAPAEGREQLAANIRLPEPNANVAPPQPDIGPDTDAALERKFAQRIKDYPRDVAAHLDYQLLQFVTDKSVPDLNTIAALPVEDREMVTALLDGLSNFRNTVRADNNTLLSKKIAPVVAMADRLAAQANLSIPTVSLCTAVQQFGVYTPVENARFVAGGDNQIILYCEVANFASHLNDRSMWETKLQYETALYTDNEAGMPVWQGKPTPITDECRNRRHDFFLADKIKLPVNLPIGGYLMKVTIVDQHASRIAEATVPLQLVAGR